MLRRRRFCEMLPADARKATVGGPWPDLVARDWLGSRAGNGTNNAVHCARQKSCRQAASFTTARVAERRNFAKCHCTKDKLILRSRLPAPRRLTRNTNLEAPRITLASIDAKGVDERSSASKLGRCRLKTTTNTRSRHLCSGVLLCMLSTSRIRW